MVASGHPQLHETDSQGPITLDANEIATVMRPDGSLESIDATGSVQGTRNTLAGEDAIEAGRVRLDLATTQNVPRLLTATGGVKLVSTSTVANGGTRRVESDALEIHFSSDSPQRQVLIESANTLAPARAEWHSVATVNGKPTQQTMRMNGKQMNLKFGPQN